MDVFFSVLFLKRLKVKIHMVITIFQSDESFSWRSFACVFVCVFSKNFFVCFARVEYVYLVFVYWTRWPQFASNNWVINCRLTQCVWSADKRYTHLLSWQTTDWALLNYRNYWFAKSVGTSDRARFIFKWLHLFRFSLSTPQ